MRSPSLSYLVRGRVRVRVRGRVRVRVRVRFRVRVRVRVRVRARVRARIRVDVQRLDAYGGDVLREDERVRRLHGLQVTFAVDGFVGGSELRGLELGPIGGDEHGCKPG